MTNSKNQVELVLEVQKTPNDLHFLHSRFESPDGVEAMNLRPLSMDNIFYGAVVGGSDLVRSLLKRIEEVSRSDSGVLIEGAKGTGKKLVARTIHRLRYGERIAMTSVNCAIVSDDCSGPVPDWMEKFERFQEGTFFLEETDNLSGDVRKKFLDVLEKKDITGIRLMVSRSACLEENVASGEFDEKLCQYFNMERIRVPSLDDRKEDIALLLVHFLEKYSGTCVGWKIEKSAFERLLSYHWRGNVRELESLVEQWSALKHNEVIKSSDLPEKFFQGAYDVYLPREGIDLKKVLSDIEGSLIRQALRISGDNKNKASRLLRLNRTTLIEKMKKKGIFNPGQDAVSK